jgi:hypothetical protein
MNTHLTHEDLVLAYYGEPEAPREHLDGCAECRAELATLAAVLDQVTPVAVPEPEAGYEARVWDRLFWRLPAERARARATNRRTAAAWIALAAVIATTFVTGVLVSRKVTAPAGAIATTTQPAAATTGSTEQQRDRILLVVVGNHFDQSERVLVELANLSADGDTDITLERERAEDLLASNRIYRRSALDRGEDNVATLLDELEPVLMQIAHAPDQVSSDELRRIQKRVEAKGLVFKLRVVRADVRADVRASSPRPVTNQPTI